jgi:hypothetical protein
LKGLSPIILRGRREKGMYFFLQVLFKVFCNYMFTNILERFVFLFIDIVLIMIIVIAGIYDI